MEARTRHTGQAMMTIHKGIDGGEAGSQSRSLGQCHGQAERGLRDYDYWSGAWVGGAGGGYRNA